MAIPSNPPQPPRVNSEEPELGNEEDIPQDDDAQVPPSPPGVQPREQAK